ncbi:MAG: helix-hairpin-helix domain-containing protein, partial [Clostridiales bacterium]|nr:helix-hairpin-helix domain-containing protein [Clostridiales bacterium]
SIEELKTLPGIGDSMARAIVNYRNENVFEKKEDIMEVSGIGEAKYNKIKDLICVK